MMIVLVPIRYSTACKAELRNVDGRFAKSVPNIFFTLKKLHALQVKDMATTALRKSKNVFLTVGELKCSENIQNILQHDKGFRFLKNLRSSPPYYQTKQKELFAMINQLGLPTFFATFSAAETNGQIYFSCYVTNLEDEQMKTLLKASPGWRNVN